MKKQIKEKIFYLLNMKNIKNWWFNRGLFIFKFIVYFFVILVILVIYYLLYYCLNEIINYFMMNGNSNSLILSIFEVDKEAGKGLLQGIESIWVVGVGWVVGALIPVAGTISIIGIPGEFGVLVVWIAGVGWVGVEAILEGAVPPAVAPAILAAILGGAIPLVIPVGAVAGAVAILGGAIPPAVAGVGAGAGAGAGAGVGAGAGAGVGAAILGALEAGIPGDQLLQILFLIFNCTMIFHPEYVLDLFFNNINMQEFILDVNNNLELSFEEKAKLINSVAIEMKGRQIANETLKIILALILSYLSSDGVGILLIISNIFMVISIYDGYYLLLYIVEIIKLILRNTG